MSCNNILLYILFFLLVGCSKIGPTAYTLHDEEVGYITDSTVIIDLNEVGRPECLLTDILGKVRYVELENSQEAMLSDIQQIRVVDSIIYVMDLDERIKCYSNDGSYIRDAVTKGRADNEIIRAYDFDVDGTYLYVLDGTVSKIKVYNHKGEFIGSRQLPFRATRLKKTTGGWIFALAPFTLNDEYEDYSVVITDDRFAIKHRYFENCIGMRYIRTPYFPCRDGFEFFNPQFGQGIYRFSGDSLAMAYYYDFDRLFPDNNEVESKHLYAVDNNMLYNNASILNTDKYIFNNFYTNPQTGGLHIIRLSDGANVFVKKVSMNHRSMLRFMWGWNINGYDSHTSEVYGPASIIFTRDVVDDDSSEKIEAMRTYLDESCREVLLRDDTNTNQVIMFAKLSDSLDTLFEHRNE